MTDKLPTDEQLFELLSNRIGAAHIRRRLGIERDSESYINDQGSLLTRIEKLCPLAMLIRWTFGASFLLQRARDNALNVRLKHNMFRLTKLPAAFDGFRILQLSDLHIDMNEQFPKALCKRIEQIDYDLCVLTGDFRYSTNGPIEPALSGMEQLRASLKEPIIGILGNHDSIRMVPCLEKMGIRMLINESSCFHRGMDKLQVVGIDDPHYFRAHNFDSACREIDENQVAILLVHSPEVFAQAAHSGFAAMLCGHTHGGQICLPGGIPLVTDTTDCPRRFARGSWRYRDMLGYTSVGAGSSIVDLRLNCDPEVTLHTLKCA